MKDLLTNLFLVSNQAVSFDTKHLLFLPTAAFIILALATSILKIFSLVSGKNSFSLHQISNLTLPLAFGFILNSIAPQVQTRPVYTLQVQFKDIQNPDKPIYISLYRSEEDFNQRKVFKHLHILPSQQTSIKIDQLPEGTYALLCFQDLNGNHQLDFNNYIPDEPWGLSNNKMLMGPPTWQDAAFKLKGNLNLDISLF